MHSELYTHPNEYSQKQFPNFGRPKVVGFLSLNGKREYLPDTSQLKFVKRVENRPVSFDLNKNLRQAKHRTEENKNEKITHLLQFLLHEEDRLKLFQTPVITLEQARFFCYRGLLTCIACTPYENQEPWRVVATLHKGSVYLCSLATEYKLERMRQMTDRDLQFTSWGYKFEQYIVSDTPSSDPDPEQPVDENEEFSLMFLNHLNKHQIVYGAEMDGIRCDRGHVDPPPQAELGVDAALRYITDMEFVEIKTNRHMEFPKQNISFRRFKTRKWWCQSFLAGVDEILCGCRNDDGIVEELKVYNVKDLSKMSAKYWNPNVCFNFLDTFLTYVKRCLAKEIVRKYGETSLKNIVDLPLIWLHLEWAPRLPVRVTNNYDPEADPILPKWYIDNIGKKLTEKKC